MLFRRAFVKNKNHGCQIFTWCSFWHCFRHTWHRCMFYYLGLHTEPEYIFVSHTASLFITDSDTQVDFIYLHWIKEAKYRTKSRILKHSAKRELLHDSIKCTWFQILLLCKLHFCYSKLKPVPKIKSQDFFCPVSLENKELINPVFYEFNPALAIGCLTKWLHRLCSISTGLKWVIRLTHLQIVTAFMRTLHLL